MTDREPCPTCSGPIRETVGMVCQTCGTDYGADPPSPSGDTTDREPMWRVMVEVPDRVADKHGLADMITDAVYEWEPDERDGWDVDITGGPAPVPPSDDVIEQARLVAEAHSEVSIDGEGFSCDACGYWMATRRMRTGHAVDALAVSGLLRKPPLRDVCDCTETPHERGSQQCVHPPEPFGESVFVPAPPPDEMVERVAEFLRQYESIEHGDRTEIMRTNGAPLRTADIHALLSVALRAAGEGQQ